MVPDRGLPAGGVGAAPLTSAEPTFSVVVPTRGEEAKLLPLLDALERQTILPGDREIILSFDGSEPSAALARRADDLGARVVRGPRAGPGAARNRGAAEARGRWLAFTEDDCVPDPDWLEHAASRLEREPDLDALEGATVSPAGRPTRRPDKQVQYLPTNLFVRRSVFEGVGGYCESFFRIDGGIYFREDSDFGFTLEEAGARVRREPSARVVHPEEHPRFLDPIRWARRYEMDALLRARHPERFRERIEVVRLGPFRLRRPFVRACRVYVLALAAALVASLAGEGGLASWFLAMAAIALVPVWAKWRFAPLRLPLIPVIPFVLVASEIEGLRSAGRHAASGQ